MVLQGYSKFRTPQPPCRDDVKNRADLDSFVSAMYNQPWEPDIGPKP